MSLGRSLDATLNVGEEIRFKQKYQKLLMNLVKECRFTYNEIEHLALIYYKLKILGEGKNRPVLRTTIKEILHNGLDMTDYGIINYMFSVLDKSLSPYMSLENWIKMMSLYLRGTLEEKIEYCYSVYLTTGITDKLARNSIIFLMKSTLFKDKGEEDEEGVKDLVDMIIKRMDYDRDGKISFEDFRSTVLENPGFLEAFGPVLPNRLAVFAFKTTLLPNIRKTI